jgi:hypothetical protein
MDIYDGANWTEMDIDDLKAEIEHGARSRKPHGSSAVPIASTTSPASAKSWALSRKQTGQRRKPAPSPLIVR